MTIFDKTLHYGLPPSWSEMREVASLRMKKNTTLEQLLRGPLLDHAKIENSLPISKVIGGMWIFLS